MRIIDLLDDNSICLKGKAANKDELLEQMIDLMAAGGKLKDAEQYRKGVYEREKEGTTGIGEGIAIPHCKSGAVSKPGLAAMVVSGGVKFDSLDGEPVDLIFLIAAPDTKENVHLDVLSRLSVLLMNEDFTNRLRHASSVKEFKTIIEEEENRITKDGRVTAVERSEGNHYILAVTGCPTGIAHTYMAAEALEKKAVELGCSIKVETRGSGGVKNELTKEEIDCADGIIVAADTKVPMERFCGKRVVTTKVSAGINKPQELLMMILNQSAPVYEDGSGEGKEETTNEDEKSGFGHTVYTHLMNGVSHMLPFVIGGGIMTAIAFLIDTIAGYGVSGGADFGSCTPLSAFFKYVGGLAMGLMVPVLAGYIAYSIADRPGLAVGFAGGLLAANGNGVLEKYSLFSSGSGSTVSGFLGGIAAGFLAGVLVLGLKKLCEKLPDSLDGIKPTLLYPLVGIFLIGIMMCMVFNPLIGLINIELGNMLRGISEAGMITLLGLILGAMMAIDMGGPINKAAYVFGTGMLATATQMLSQGAQPSDPGVQACYMAMAAIMAGGMVPPVGIALACRLFKNRFTEAERGSVISNIVMGCSFITEGAIPFAASDPIHVIPCTMVGAGTAGFLSALFGCTLMAPHGGVFVFATVGRPFLYIAAWLGGSVVTALMLGVIKKELKAK